MTPDPSASLKKRDVQPSRFFLVMGVSGCGKSTLAHALAEKFSGTYLEGDDFHSAANKEKMSAGIPLDDQDRSSWLASLNTELKKYANGEAPVFLACSALKRTYRDQLTGGLPAPLTVIYLKGSFELIRSRLASRSGHFMPPVLLQSQFDILEEPEAALVLDVSTPLAGLVRQACSFIGGSDR
jgi:gluconokinase